MGVTNTELELLRRESGLRTDAQNPHSTAFGMWQGIKGQRLKYAGRFGFNLNTTNDREQLIMFRAYYKERYGSVQAALAFWDRNHYY